MDLKIDLVGGVQIKKALDDLQRNIKKKEEVALNKAAQFITVAIKDRTAKGIGVNKQGRRKEFKPYSDAYLKFLVSKRNKENASSRVNLLFSGLMLANLQPKKVSTFIRRVHFPNKRENLKARFHDEIGAGKGKVKRPFMNVSKEEEERMRKIFNKEIDKIRF